MLILWTHVLLKQTIEYGERLLQIFKFAISSWILNKFIIVFTPPNKI